MSIYNFPVSYMSWQNAQTGNKISLETIPAYTWAQQSLRILFDKWNKVGKMLNEEEKIQTGFWSSFW